MMAIGQTYFIPVAWSVSCIALFAAIQEGHIIRSNHRLDISLRYTFNASKSKYKGTGAGQAERQRM